MFFDIKGDLSFNTQAETENLVWTGFYMEGIDKIEVLDSIKGFSQGKTIQFDGKDDIALGKNDYSYNYFGQIDEQNKFKISVFYDIA